MTEHTLQTLEIHRPDSDTWEEIRKYRDLPILAETRAAMRRQLRKASLSFEKLADLAEQDPAICLHMLMRIADRHPDSLNQIATASGCISLLGMEEVVKLVKHLPVVEAGHPDRRYRDYVATLQSASLAGRLAASWAHHKPGLSAHQAQWAAMLASAPFWGWHFFQVEAIQATAHSICQGRDISPSIALCFGKHREKQWRLLCHSLGLPSVCRSIWDKRIWPDKDGWRLLRKNQLQAMDGQRALKHQCLQPEMLVLCTNMLATQYRFGPNRSKARRWAELAAHTMNVPVTQVHRETTKQILSLAGRFQHSVAAQGLVSETGSAWPFPEPIHCIPDLPPADRLHMEWENPPPAKPPAKPPERKLDQKSLKSLLSKLSKNPEMFGDWHHLMRCVLKGITENIGLSRAYIAIQNKQRTAAKVYYQEGLAETDPLCQWAIDLKKPTLFRKMLERPASLMITPDNRAKMLRGLSESDIRQLPDVFLVMSLFANDRPIGIIFADAGTEKTIPVQPAEYMAFKTLCMTATKSLGILARNPPRQAGSVQRRA